MHFLTILGTNRCFKVEGAKNPVPSGVDEEPAIYLQGTGVYTLG